MSAIPAATTPVVATLWTRRASQVLGAPAATVTFSGLFDNAYRVSGIYAPTGSAGSINVLLNNDTDAALHYVSSTGKSYAGAAAGYRATQASWYIAEIGYATQADLPGNFMAIFQKPLAAEHGHGVGSVAMSLSSANTNQYGGWFGGRWLNTADLITRLDIVVASTTFKAGSAFTVEGMN